MEKFKKKIETIVEFMEDPLVIEVASDVSLVISIIALGISIIAIINKC